jgi:hypothetical protein
MFDREGLKFTVKVTLANGDKLPSFIKYSKGYLTFTIPDV